MKSLAQVLRSPYSNKMSSPAWKTFARNVRQQKGNFCHICKRGNITTQVHHIYYEQGLEPWEHPLEACIVLCEGCHKAMHKGLNDFRQHVFGAMTPAALRVINGALAVGLGVHDPLILAYAIAEMVGSPGAVARFSSAWARGESTVLKPNTVTK